MQFVPVTQPCDIFSNKLENLYLSSFPEYERKPIDKLYQHQKGKQSEVLAVLDHSDFIGMLVTIFTNDVIILEYLAVDPSHRNKNYGSRILSKLQEYYPNQPIILEIEQTSPIYSDNTLRIKRRHFYERNNFYFLNQSINFFNTQLDLMSTQQNFTYETYIQPYIDVYGPDITNNIYLI